MSDTSKTNEEQIKDDTEKIDLLEKEIQLLKERQSTQLAIEEALTFFDFPNRYIEREIDFAEKSFYAFKNLGFGFGILFILSFFASLAFTWGNIPSESTEFKDIYEATPALISLSLMSYFFRSMFKKRSEIRTLQNQKSNLEIIKSSHLAHSMLQNQEETLKELSHTILKLRDAAIEGFTIQQTKGTGILGSEKESSMDISKVFKTLKDTGIKP